MDTMFWEECMTSMHICLHISLYGYFLIKKKQIVDGKRNKYPFFSQCRWVTGVTAPSTKKQKTRVTGVTQQTGSNKRLGRKRWQVTLLYTLFFMTYRAKIDKRLIIRGRHPNWRVVSPMHKKRWKIGVTVTFWKSCKTLCFSEITYLQERNDLFTSLKWLDYES